MNPNEINSTAEMASVKQAAELKEEANGRDGCSTRTEKKRGYTVSAKVVAANRKNTLRSAGPRTARGKEASRMNAVKHGILSGAVAVRGVQIQEQEGEFKMLREQCWECLAPVGRIEEMLVDRIVTAQWRLRRVLMAETGEIALSVDRGLKGKEDPQRFLWKIFLDPTSDVAEQMEKSTQGLECLKALVETVRIEVKQEGELTEAIYERLVRRFRDTPNSLTQDLLQLRERMKADREAVEKAFAFAKATADTSAFSETTANDRADTSTATAPCAMEDKEEFNERWRRVVLQFIDEKLAAYEELSAGVEEQDDKDDTARQAANVLPSAEVLEKILRYESGLERQLYRAMNQLERLQRRREGEEVKAPLMMDVMK